MGSLREKISVKTKKLSITKLLDYYHPDEILGYCSNCSNHGRFWSCPPHSFDILTYFQQFNFVYVIASKIHLDPSLSKEESIEYFYKQRIKINEKLEQVHERIPDVSTLMAGQCWHCKKCAREEGKPCVFPEKVHYSLESLGIKISALLEQEFNDRLQWQKNEMPDYLYTVQAILSETPLSEDIITVNDR